MSNQFTDVLDAVLDHRGPVAQGVLGGKREGEGVGDENHETGVRTRSVDACTCVILNLKEHR